MPWNSLPTRKRLTKTTMNTANAKPCLFAHGQWEELAELLRNELQEYGEFLVLLDEQQQAIISQDIETLRALEESIQQQIQLTQEVRTYRSDMVATFAQLAGQPADTSLRQLLPYFPDASRPMMMALINEINALIEKTRKSLRQNHILLSRASEVTEKILMALNPVPTTKTYGSTGKVSFKTERVGSCIRTSA